MRALSMLCFACWLVIGQASAQDSAAPVRARLECEPAQAEIGEPVEWVLTVEHPRAIAVKLPEKDPVLGDSWVMLGDRSVVKDVPSGAAGATVSRAAGDAVSRAAWRVMSLEPGSRALPAIDVQYEEAGVQHTVTAAPVVLEVRGELAPDEDAPRPMKGFRPPPVESAVSARWPWIAAFLVVAGAMGWWIARRLRRKPAPVATATPLDRLADLERGIGADPSSGRAVTYALSMLLRESVDAFARDPRAGLTDSDWIERIQNDERVPLGVRGAVARILRESEQVKYAQQVPTRFAVDEMLRDARHALEALAAAPAPEPASSASPTGAEKEAA